MDTVTPLTCIMMGPSDLRTVLRLRAFEAIQQRVGLRFHLAGLSESDTTDCVGHHCQQEGALRLLFTPSALRLLFVPSQGLPRVINRLALGALWDAASAQAPMVDEPTYATCFGRLEGSLMAHRLPEDIRGPRTPRTVTHRQRFRDRPGTIPTGRLQVVVLPYAPWVMWVMDHQEPWWFGNAYGVFAVGQGWTMRPRHQEARNLVGP